MHYSILFLIWIISTVHSFFLTGVDLSRDPAEILREFGEFKKSFNRNYINMKDEIFRRSVFFENMKKIKSLNAKAKGNVEYGLNHFSDWTEEEFKNMIPHSYPNTTLKNLPVYNPAKNTRSKRSTLPDHLDLRNVRQNGRFIIGDVKNQGSCGCCWAFAAVAVAEAAYSLKYGTTMYLSDQEICDCANGGYPGCLGGNVYDAMDHLWRHGVTEEHNYEYVDGRSKKTGICLNKPRVMRFANYYIFNMNRRDKLYAMKHSMVHLKTPIAVSFRIGADFQYYKRGILVHEGCYDHHEKLYHAAAIVGYGTEMVNGRYVDYWVLKNSWKYDWGENGYVKIAAGINWCGIEAEPITGHM